MSRNKKKVISNRPNGRPVFNYTSTCCNEPAQKPALVRTEEATGTLGHWRCGKCSKGCKVKRSKAKESNGATEGTGTNAE
jgi:hypothetical protein